jgi:uncharacterized protein YjbI with pentapeptide repeats
VANQEQIKRLIASSEERNWCATWNRWRKDHDEILIDLSGADLSNAYLSRIDLRNANLSRADLRHAYLQSAHFSGADLRYAYLASARLRNTYFRDTRLIGADLRATDLSVADLTGADLTNVDLTDASLKDTYFRNTNLSGANFTNTDLIGAHLKDAYLKNTCLNRAILGWTTFGNVDLRQVTGLETVVHQGPSNIATNVFYASHGEIPDVFLRGCGLTDEMIDFAHSIAGAIQYYSIFISYNHEDETFATRLYNDLQANNVRCWKYTEDQKIGAHIRAGVFDAIRLHDKLLVILSESSLASEWVSYEVDAAMEREENEHKSILFPVRIDDAIDHISSPWAEKIRRHRNIGDFRAWKDQDHYQPMFERLLRDLKQSASA